MQTWIKKNVEQFFSFWSENKKHIQQCLNPTTNNKLVDVEKSLELQLGQTDQVSI